MENFKTVETNTLVLMLEEIGLIYKPNFEGKVITNYDGVVKKEMVLSNLKNWESSREMDYEGYISLTDPFNSLSPYASFEGKSQVFSNDNFESKLCDILKQKANKNLLPFLHYPYRSIAAIHCLYTGAGNETYCLVKELKEIVSYWTSVIQELFSRIDERDGMLWEIRKHPIIVESKELYRKNNFEIRFGKFFNYRSGESYNHRYIDNLKLLATEFPNHFKINDLRETTTNAKIKIEIAQSTHTEKAVTKNGLDDYAGEPLYLLSSQGGGWFMRPKGGFDGVANPDAYEIDKGFTATISIH